jgi:hypothetical protein
MRWAVRKVSIYRAVSPTQIVPVRVPQFGDFYSLAIPDQTPLCYQNEIVHLTPNWVRISLF